MADHGPFAGSANDRYYELIGNRDILGKTVREAVPEIEGQGIIALLDRAKLLPRRLRSRPPPRLERIVLLSTGGLASQGDASPGKFFAKNWESPDAEVNAS